MSQSLQLRANVGSVVCFERSLLESSAWRELPGNSVKIYIRFRQKLIFARRSGPPGNPARQRNSWIMINNSELTFTYSEAQLVFGMSRATFSAALKHLVFYGFIDVTRKGHASKALAGRAETLFAICDRWVKYGTSEFISSIDCLGPDDTYQVWNKTFLDTFSPRPLRASSCRVRPGDPQSDLFQEAVNQVNKASEEADERLKKSYRQK